MTTDPGLTPALSWWRRGPVRTGVSRGGGPERVVTDEPSDHRRRRVGFNGGLEYVDEED